MRIASVLTPFSDKNLQLAAQAGVTDVTIRCPGDLSVMKGEQERAEAFGLRVSAIEGNLPIENIKWGNDKADAEIEKMKAVLRHMGSLGIPIACYNFMAGTDWVRTRTDVKERGGALVTAFNLDEAYNAISLGSAGQDIGEERISEEELWVNLEHFLREVIPVAEEAGVTLAMHPDDPPLPSFKGKDRIMNSVENFEKLVLLVPSPSNTICFCQGTFAEMGVDIPQTIRRLGPHIRFVHFRDVRGTPKSFTETFHDNGPTDMYAAICAYHDIGFDGPMRPDHVPQLVGEEDGKPGYTMQGRLFVFGYMRGLIEAAEKRDKK